MFNTRTRNADLKAFGCIRFNPERSKKEGEEGYRMSFKRLHIWIKVEKKR